MQCCLPLRFCLEGARCSSGPLSPKRAYIITLTTITHNPNQAGVIEAGVCLFAYFVVFWTNGITGKDLFNFGTVCACAPVPMFVYVWLSVAALAL